MYKVEPSKSGGMDWLPILSARGSVAIRKIRLSSDVDLRNRRQSRRTGRYRACVTQGQRVPRFRSHTPADGRHKRDGQQGREADCQCLGPTNATGIVTRIKAACAVEFQGQIQQRKTANTICRHVRSGASKR